MVFIPITERHRLMAAIGLWVFGEACRQAAQWHEAGLRMRIAVKIPCHQLRRNALVDPIEASLRHHRVPPGRLTCEFTEAVAIEDAEVTRQAFERLRRAGLYVLIDDFGTGHFSLTCLRHLPAADLKIDRAVVGDPASGDGARTTETATPSKLQRHSAIRCFNPRLGRRWRPDFAPITSAAPAQRLFPTLGGLQSGGCRVCLMR